MDLAPKLLRQIDNPNLNPSERARLRCTLAWKLEEAGDYEAAREAMGELWQRVGEHPALEGLDKSATAEVLMRAGALSGWLGSAHQVAGAQEKAKDLLSQSIALFEALTNTEKVAEAQIELAYCYWREGGFDEARITLREALSHLTNSESELKAVALLRCAIVERSAKRLSDALYILTEAAPLFEKSSNHSIRGRFHVGLATTLKNLGTIEERQDYIDRALVEYAAASFHFEQAGHKRYCARVENNLGFLFLTLARFDEAHDHLNRARRLFVSLKDSGSTAQVDETRARALLAQGRNAEAEQIVGAAVRTLEKGDEQALLAEALTTHGVALARLGQQEQSRLVLERAITVAEQAGDLEGAGRAALTLMEELKARLTEDELRAVYCRADQLLSRSQHTETIARLRECARHVVSVAEARAEKETPANFVYSSEKTAKLLRMARLLATLDYPALITGETGTGKEVLARLIHEWSGRAGRFVAINCAALTDTLIESQLFGHRNNSFTNAAGNYPGAVREAAGGTLLLDEITELSRYSQMKILRLIEHGEIHPLGAATPERVNVRIITSSSRDLKEMVAQGHFRSDLFYRLQTFQLEIPPLRERPEDICAIAEQFIAEACHRHQKRVTFSPASLEAMRQLPLRGNARELRTLIERTVLNAADGAEISAESVEVIALRQTRKADFADVWEGCSLVEEVSGYEKSLIRRALNTAQGGVTRAARLLGITHQSLSAILNNRHQDLLSARKPVQKRRRSIIHDGGRPSRQKKRRRKNRA